MATAGLLALIDDIATLLDDVALLTKATAKKTAGVLGDDLALNAEQVSGVRAERELPVVWAVAKGSIVNKLILVPLALLLSLFMPWMITPLLMVGGTYLCFEGFEKISHRFWHHTDEDVSRDKARIKAMIEPGFDVLAFEKKKISGAIRTDFILSAEIVVIALGSVQEVELLQQVVVLSVIALAITVAVYGVVAGLVKLDDAGLYLMNTKQPGILGKTLKYIGRWTLLACPKLMKTLSALGTVAMFLVGGGILVHSIPLLHGLLQHVEELPAPVFLSANMFNGVIGIVVGALIVLFISLKQKVFSR